jgi:hypothetical protein
VLLQVVAFDLPPIEHIEAIGALPFHEERALVDGRHRGQELGSTQPAIRDDYRRWQCHAAAAACCNASIEPALHPAPFVTARRPRTWRGGPMDGKVDGHHQLALANDHDQQHPIKAREHPVRLATPQGPTRPTCSPSFLHPEASPTHIHCHRLRVASLVLAA